MAREHRNMTICLTKNDDGHLEELGNICPRLTSEWNHPVNADETNVQASAEISNQIERLAWRIATDLPWLRR